MMPVYNDGPTHPAICTNVVISATPNGFWSGGSTRSPAVCDGEKMNPTAAYMSRAAANTTGTDSVGLTTANAKKPTAMPANPSGSSGHSPRRSMIRPPTSVAPAFASTGISITSPAESAVMPAAPSKYSGSSTLMENVLIMATVANSKAGQNRRFLMGARSMSGWSQRSWRTTNAAARATVASSAAAATSGLMVSCDKPNDSAVSTTADSATDTTSRCASLVSRFFTKKKPMTASTAMAATGTTKMLCQPNAVTSAPHTTGAKAGPNVIMHPPMDMNDPSRFFGVTARMVFIISGMKMPVPTACTSRATSSTAKLPANSPAADPAMLKAAAAKNSVRSLKRR